MEKKDPTEVKAKKYPSPKEVAESIKVGYVPKDNVIDRYLPVFFRYVSSQYWTPIKVALRASQWLREVKVKTVLDVGSGPGKFCVVGALATECSFVGIEQRERLHLVARDLARRFGVEGQVRFIHGTFGVTPLENFDAYYFYNPFGENTFSPSDWLDRNVELSIERYEREVALAEQMMQRFPVGTYVICYNGFGGTMPENYKVVRSDLSASSLLQMWKKTAPVLQSTLRNQHPYFSCHPLEAMRVVSYCSPK
jgi:hypothetical protein